MAWQRQSTDVIQKRKLQPHQGGALEAWDAPQGHPAGTMPQRQGLCLGPVDVRNQLARRLNADAPNTKWATEFNYLCRIAPWADVPTLPWSRDSQGASGGSRLTAVDISPGLGAGDVF